MVLKTESFPVDSYISVDLALESDKKWFYQLKRN